MIYRLERLIRSLRRSVSRSEWSMRLLRLARHEGAGSGAGLVLVQIDGLSFTEASQAIQAGKMPHLARLLERERYSLAPTFSGVPSNTPAFQGELFFGVKASVPSFSFLHRDENRIFRMLDQSSAAEIEERLRNRGEPLLAGGSAFSDIFTGGAEEPNYCASTFGWSEALGSINPLRLGLFAALHPYSFVRTAAYSAIETGLALGDFIRGWRRGHPLVNELRFVPTRVLAAALLREVVTSGAKVDLARGLPIVHVNLVGYDEQAHHRGPASGFARWTLQGIDDAISRIWRAARRSESRDYDVWIYSDHGQADVVPFEEATGRPIEEAVASVLDRWRPSPADARRMPFPFIASPRREPRLESRLMRLFPAHHASRDGARGPEATPGRDVTVTAQGPIGSIYVSYQLGPEERDQIARELVAAGIPLVVRRSESGGVVAWSDEGSFRLPDQAEHVLGADHPFLSEAARDLEDLARHPHAGEFVIFGWRRGAQALTFADERGAHGGAHPEEVRGFAALPVDAPLPDPGAAALRAGDLRAAALHHLGRVELPPRCSVRPSRSPRTLRIMTFNVHSCLGMDGRISPRRVARVIAQFAPDIVALQEVDAGRPRTRGEDQAHLIAKFLQMDFHFHPSVHIEEERYGNAVLTHFPMRLVRAAGLPGLPGLEPRGALWVDIDVDGSPLQLLATHFGLRRRERRLQAEALLGPDWLGSPDCRAPTILCGDLNSMPGSAVCNMLGRRLLDAQTARFGARPHKGFPARFPSVRIDHIFVDPAIRVVRAEIGGTELARAASDHLPLVAELLVPGAEAPADQ